MNRSHLLINEPSLQVLPSLAKAVGLDEAIVLQQLHYWLNNPKSAGRIDENGDKWVYNTYAEWQEDNFPFWSEDKIQRIFLSLEKQKVVISAQLDAKKRDMKKFYCIDYDELCMLHGADLQPSIVAVLHDVKMNQRLPETTTEKAEKSSSSELPANMKTDEESPEYEVKRGSQEWKDKLGDELAKQSLEAAIHSGNGVRKGVTDKNREAFDLEIMIDEQLARLPLNWTGFKETDKENFRKFLKKERKEKGRELGVWVNWWMSDEWRVANPPWKLDTIKIKWLEAFTSSTLETPKSTPTDEIYI